MKNWFQAFAFKCNSYRYAVLLSGKPAGSSIDAHDVVVRLNQAPTKSYTARVGSKATWRILNKSWVVGYGGLLRREHGSVSKADLPNEKGVHMLAGLALFPCYFAVKTRFS